MICVPLSYLFQDVQMAPQSRGPVLEAERVEVVEEEVFHGALRGDLALERVGAAAAAAVAAAVEVLVVVLLVKIVLVALVLALVVVVIALGAHHGLRVDAELAESALELVVLVTEFPETKENMCFLNKFTSLLRKLSSNSEVANGVTGMKPCQTGTHIMLLIPSRSSGSMSSSLEVVTAAMLWLQETGEREKTG